MYGLAQSQSKQAEASSASTAGAKGRKSSRRLIFALM
jgi:hypothetical protein